MVTPQQNGGTDSRTPTVVWSGLLFFVFPLVGEIIVWLSFQVFGLSWAQERAWPGADQYGAFAVILAPLALSYLPVRRLSDPVLPWLWLYGIVAGAIAIGSGPILAHHRYTHRVRKGHHRRLGHLHDHTGLVFREECRRNRSDTHCYSYAWLPPRMFPAASFHPSSWQDLRMQTLFPRT